MSQRLDQIFAACRQAGRAARVAYVVAGDPDPAVSREILLGLPDAGADIVELGMPFSDPMADGPDIQQGALRALRAGQRMQGTLEMARAFRQQHPGVPLVLMGYFNPLASFGIPAFVAAAAEAGVDALLIVDLPVEHDDELGPAARAHGLDIVRLVTPTSDPARLDVLLKEAGGFVYYTSVAGVTGGAAPDARDVARAVARIREHTSLPVAVGFGIRSRALADEIGQVADAVVIGSELVRQAAGDAAGAASRVLGRLRELSGR